MPQSRSNEPTEVANELDPSSLLLAASPEIIVSEFNNSVENHFNFIDAIARLCGQAESVDSNQAAIGGFSESITFLREWKDFSYAPQSVRFAFQHNYEEKDVIGGVTLPQFSSASVPKQQTLEAEGKFTNITESSNDFVMYVGGAVWALDWCPRAEHKLEKCQIVPEFVAVAAHPPESSYHKIGAPLTGRGAIQIWCVLTICEEEDELANSNGKQKPTKRKGAVMASESKLQRPRGRPRKKPLSDSLEKVHANDPFVQPLVVQYPDDSTESHSAYKTTSKHLSNDSDLTQKEFNHTENVSSLVSLVPKCRGNQGSSPNCHLTSLRPHNKTNSLSSCDANTSKYFIPKDIALPRVMLCLAHNGKVAWDVKWRPHNGYNPQRLNQMGYLAVVLGNGALEVWDVPHPHAVKLVYPAHEEHVDPRFVKLQPVFKCTTLKCGDRQSIPLAVEWSVSSSHDMILAGCHDGVVALWKFSITDPSTETRPLLSFSADTCPIRTLAWAPNQGDVESANIIVTAGHKGFKFWDIRDPFRPLWDHPIQGVAYSLQWLPDPRCVIGSIDDGTLWSLNLVKTPLDIPVSGKPLAGSKTGIHNLDCSSFCIWSVHGSHLTGTVAYCGEEGKTFCFQPTTRSVSDPSRHRLNHYLCGSLLEEESGLIILSRSTTVPLLRKSPGLKRGFPSAKNPEKKAKDSIPEELQSGSNSVDEVDCHVSSADTQKQTLRSKQTSKNELEKYPETSATKLERKTNEVEVFPPKIVAMHRVRWSANKGSKKWLCYGGASGMIRCQEVNISAFK